MFNLENRQLHISGLYDIIANYCSLINDGENDLLYTGTNNFNSKILGSILFEDDEALYLRYVHSLVSDEMLHDFLNKKISLKDIIISSNSVFIVNKNYNSEIIDYALIPIQDFPDDYLPLENSFCPGFVKQNTFDYTFSLKGGLADLHKAEPLVMSDTNSKVFKLLGSATNFLNELDIYPKIYSEVALADSFELNFEIELSEKLNLFSKPINDLKRFFYTFFNYVFDKLPNEPENVLKNEENATEELKSLYNQLEAVYNNRNIILAKDVIEQRIINLITYSVDSIKDIEYKGYNKIEVSNKLKNGDVLPVALIKTDYYESVANKIFKPEQEEKPDIILLDENSKTYKIQVYSLNKETGNGGAYYIANEGVNKITLHLRGQNEYHGTVFTKSLDENISVDIQGIGKRVNNILKEITVNL